MPTDFAGNSINAARPLGAMAPTSITYSDFVGAADLYDWYSFSTSSARNFRAALTGLAADADLYLLNSAGTVIAFSDNLATAAEAIVMDSLAAGSYYVRVERYEGDTYYSLALQAGMADDTPATARNIGALSAAQVFSDHVGTLDDAHDYYTFTTSGRTNFSLSLAGLSADADVELLASDGVTQLAYSWNGGITAESIVRTGLEAGTYYVHVYPYSGSTNYSLTLSAPAAIPADAAGNSAAAARDIGALGTSLRSFGDYVGSVDTNDYYRFTVPAPTSLALTLVGLATDADVQVLGSNGSTMLGSSSLDGSSNESINLNLAAAGIYYVRVYPYSGSTSYTLNLTGTPLAPADPAGNSPGAARAISVLGAATQTFSDFVGAVDTDDYYSFTTTGLTNFRLALNGLSADADVELLDTSYNTLQSSLNWGSAAESIAVDRLAAGTYYIHVEQYTGDTSYSLAVSAAPAAPVDNAGNTLALARNVGALSTTQTFSDYVGVVDTSDYYRFTVAYRSVVNLALTGMGADANLALLSSAGSSIAASSNLSNANDAISGRTVEAGTYYVRVAPAGAANTSYTLSLAASTVAPTDLAGNAATTLDARNIGALGSTRQTFTDYVGSEDLHDYYRFTTTTNSNFGLTLSGLTADADVNLVASDGSTVLAYGAAGGTLSESIVFNNLAAGSYYIHVVPYSGSTNYTLGVVATATADGAGNTTALARQVGTLTSTERVFTDFFGTGDPDFYKFSTTVSSNFRLSLAGLTDDADVELLAANGTTILDDSINSGTSADSIAHDNLAAGTYYVRVFQGIAGANGSYSLTLSAGPGGASDDSTGSATSMGTLSSATVTRSGFVGAGDPVDYYSFSTGARSNLRLSLTGLTADADVELIDALTGSTVATSSLAGTASEAISFNGLAAGDYFIRVYHYSGNTNYNLTARAEALAAVADGAGNTTPAARNIGTLGATQQTFNDFVGAGDMHDYYRFITTGASNFRLQLDGMSADADVALLTSAGESLASGVVTATGVESISADNLAAGTYYVHVTPGSGDTNYRLAVSAQAPSDSAGNTYGAANNLGAVGATTRTVAGFVGSSDTHDWYRFNTAASSNFRLGLGALTADADVYLYAADGTTLIASSSAGGTTAETILRNGLAAGTYYVDVRQYSGNTNYSLTLAAAALADTAPNTIATARALTLGTTPVAITEFVGAADAYDYYRFTLAQRNSVSLALGGLSGNADMQLLGGVNGATVIASSAATGTAAESISALLNPGTYYLRVYPGAIDANADYTLTASAAPLAPVDAAGNTMPAARVIVPGVTQQSFSDYVGPLDSDDYYRFTLSAANGLRVALTGAVSLADVALYSAAGTVVAASRSPSDAGSESLEFDRLAAGTYYLRVVPSLTPGEGFYTLGVRTVAADDFIASIASSGRVTANGALVPGNLENAYDIDWFAVNLTSGVAYTVREYGLPSANGTLSDTAIKGIYDAAGSLIGNTSNDNMSLTSRDSLLVYTPATTATYYIAAGSAEGQTGTYKLGVSSINLAPVVNQVLAAQTAREGTAWSYILPWNLFSDPENEALTLTAVQANGRPLPSWLSFDANARAFSGTAPANADDLTLRLVATDPHAASVNTQFTLRTVAGGSDDFSADIQTTGAVAVGGSARGTIETANDIDWICVALTSGTLYTIDLRGSPSAGGTLPDTLLQGLFDATGQSISNTGNDDSEASRDSRVQFTPSSSGNYYIAASGYGTNTGTYSVVVTAGTANRPPVVSVPIADQDVREGQALSLQVAQNAFTDPDSQMLTYAATQASGSALPTWLQFNAATRTFTGTPPANGPDITLRVSARDTGGLTAADDFVLRTQAAGIVASNQATWTIMVYLAADNNLESAAIDDINEMELANLPANVNVVVMVDRAPGYDTSNGNWTDTRRGRISNDSNPSSISSTLTSIGEVNTGSQQTLTDFINWGSSNYRADHYALVIWDHGGGLDGTSWDDSNNNDNLSIAETTRAISNSTLGRFDFIGFDTCLQGMVEQVADLRTRADVIVASENVEPGDGWDYQNWLGGLRTSPNMTAEQLGTRAVSTYQDFYSSVSGGNETTLSAINTSLVDELTTSINNFVSASSDMNPTDKSNLRTARDASRNFPDRPDNRDLGDFMDHVAANNGIASDIRTSAQAVSTALSNAVLSHTTLMSNTEGLAIFLPSTLGAATASYYSANNYSFLGESTWRNFAIALNS